MFIFTSIIKILIQNRNNPLACADLGNANFGFGIPSLDLGATNSENSNQREEVLIAKGSRGSYVNLGPSMML